MARFLVNSNYNSRNILQNSSLVLLQLMEKVAFTFYIKYQENNSCTKNIMKYTIKKILQLLCQHDFQ